MVPFRELVYLPDEDRYEEVSARARGTRTLAPSPAPRCATSYLNAGAQLPDWFTRPEVAEILAETLPAAHRQGFCVWFTGLERRRQVDDRRGAGRASR